MFLSCCLVLMFVLLSLYSYILSFMLLMDSRDVVNMAFSGVHQLRKTQNLILVAHIILAKKGLCYQLAGNIY